MLAPKRVKYRKTHKGRMRGNAQRGNQDEIAVERHRHASPLPAMETRTGAADVTRFTEEDLALGRKIASARS